MVNTILCVTAFCHFTIVNVHLVCRDSNGGRMKVKFTVVNRHEKECRFLSRVEGRG